MSSHDEQRFDRAAWSWVEHVRTGGTTPWLRWAEADPDADHSVDALPERRLPGAAQLEVVRRLAERSAAQGADNRAGFTALADLVLGRSGPGRGLGELPLFWPGSQDGPARVGAPPVDPDRIAHEELVRVCVGVLVELLGGVRPDTRAPRAPRRWPWARQFYLAGAPVSTSQTRIALAAAGHVEGGRKPTVLVIGCGFDEMMKQVWTARVQRYGADARWGRFVAKWERLDRLPLSADLPMIAAHWADRVGRDRVHILVSGNDDAALRRTAAGILGVPVPEDAASSPFDIRRMRPAEVDVLRRVNAVLNVRAGEERRRTLRPTLVGLLSSGRTSPMLVPSANADWAGERSLKMAADLEAGGYTVHGDLQQIVCDRGSGTKEAPGGRRVLEVALGACLRLSRTTGVVQRGPQ